MTMNQAAITAASFQANIRIGGVVPFSEGGTLAVPINFSTTKYLKVFTGTYTPNNDYLYLWQSIPADQAPNFMILIVDKQLALTMNFAKGSIVYSPKRFTFIEWAYDAANLLGACFIDGRLGPNPGNTPMDQGVAVNYTIIFGQAAIS